MATIATTERPLAHVGRARRSVVAGVGAFFRRAYETGLTGMAAMVAYNLLLSIFPLALIALFISGKVLSSESLEASVVADLQRIFPSETEGALRHALDNIQHRSTTTGVLALLVSLWVGSSFWGALDTAFARINGTDSRPWVRQKLFSVGMLGVVLLFFAASVSIPAVQSLLVKSARDLPFGLDRVHGLVFGLSLAGGLVLLFATLCLVYWRVPVPPSRWRSVWPGALGATLAMGVVDYGFPLYLTNISTLASVGTSVVFALIALVWFYVLAIILLGGALLNSLRSSAPVESGG